MKISRLKIIHLRARIQRLYRFNKFQFYILTVTILFLILFLLSCILHVFSNVSWLPPFKSFDELTTQKNPYDSITVNTEKDTDETLNGKSFYERMLEDYKDEISSSEDLQLKVMSNIIKDSIYVNQDNNKIDKNLQTRLDLLKKKKQLDGLILPENDVYDPKTIQKNKIDSIKSELDQLEYDSSKFIPKAKLEPIKRLFTNLLPIIITCQPKLAYQLKNEKNDDSYRRKFSFGKKKMIPRTYGKSGIVNIAFHDTSEKFPILSENYLSESLFLPDDMFLDLKHSHHYFVNHIPDSYSLNTYSGEGIVFIGGGKFSWLSLLSIENIRSAGSKLPIEVMIPEPDEYEPQLCEEILPKLNAKCLLLYEVFPDITSNLKSKSYAKNFKLTGYQYKSLSLLASTFEKVLFLDSDNISVLNPDVLFYSEPFTSSGMILWPDFWRRVTHPKYYELAGFNITKTRVRNLIDKVTPHQVYFTGDEDVENDIPLHDREGAIPDLSSESGQIIVNKKTHFKALLLSFYYNVYGPRHYYPLFSQGGNGEGDKETFIAAATYYNLPVYQMNKPVGVVGHWNDNDYEGVGMIQYDPITDKVNEDYFKEYIINRIEEEGSSYQFNKFDFFNFLNIAESRPMFFHSNYPKLDPISLFNDKKVFDPNGKPWRMYSDQPDIGFDFELKQWNLIDKYFCSQTDTLQLKYIEESNVDMVELCRKIKRRLYFLRSTKLDYNYYDNI